jgi:hypothetical protein
LKVGRASFKATPIEIGSFCRDSLDVASSTRVAVDVDELGIDDEVERRRTGDGEVVIVATVVCDLREGEAIDIVEVV